MRPDVALKELRARCCTCGTAPGTRPLARVIRTADADAHYIGCDIDDAAEDLAARLDAFKAALDNWLATHHSSESDGALWALIEDFIDDLWPEAPNA